MSRPGSPVVGGHVVRRGLPLPAGVRRGLVARPGGLDLGTGDAERPRPELHRSVRHVPGHHGARPDARDHDRGHRPQRSRNLHARRRGDGRRRTGFGRAHLDGDRRRRCCWRRWSGWSTGSSIGGLGLNALIVTLAVGQIVSGVAFRYYTEVAIQTPVPEGLSDVDHHPVPRRHADLLGGRGHDTGLDRPVPVHDAGPEVPGGRCQPHGVVDRRPPREPQPGVRLRDGGGPLRAGGHPAGVVPSYRRASPSGPRTCSVRSPPWSSAGPRSPAGLASPLSTWVAAFFLAGLTQMMRVMGLPTALQFVVFGIVIVGRHVGIRGSDHPGRGARSCGGSGRMSWRHRSSARPARGRDEEGGHGISESQRSGMTSAIDARRGRP